PPCCAYSNVPAPTQTSTLSLHDALPISVADLAGDMRRLQHLLDAAAAEVGAQHVEQLGHGRPAQVWREEPVRAHQRQREHQQLQDRKSTRLNSSHVKISYAVFCLKKKSE